MCLNRDGPNFVAQKRPTQSDSNKNIYKRGHYSESGVRDQLPPIEFTCVALFQRRPQFALETSNLAYLLYSIQERVFVRSHGDFI